MRRLRPAARLGAVALVAAFLAGQGCQPASNADGPGTGGAPVGGSPSGTGGAGYGGTPGSGGDRGSGGTPGGGVGGGTLAGSGGMPGGGSGGVVGGGGKTGSGGATGSTGGAGGAAFNGPLVPAQGALLGAYVGGTTVSSVEGTLGRKLAIVHNFFGWSDNWVTWARSTLQTGATALVTWETWNNNVGVPLDDIISGKYDSMINTRAQDAKAIGQQFFLRWGHEMNGNWYPWDGSHNGANAAATAKFVTTFKHIHDLFTAAGATKVLWVFCPNVDSVPNASWNQWSNYYPGDAYVDWMGFDGYNWGTVQTGSVWRSFSSITGTIYDGLAASSKPIMIPETASTELGGDKAGWISAILPALHTLYPGIKALVWFDINKETDWRIDSSTTSRAAFVQMANDPYFNP